MELEHLGINAHIATHAVTKKRKLGEKKYTKSMILM
jgi:hypothetical protein